MIQKTLALVGSNNRDSINRKLINYVSERFENTTVDLHSWLGFNIPIYSKEIEMINGVPQPIIELKNTIDQYKALIISVNEYNLSISSFFKNIIDWLSRVDPLFLDQKKVLVMSTSASEKGAVHALEYMKKVLPTLGAVSVESFSIPLFHENFDSQKLTIKNEIMLLGIMDILTNFEHHLED